MTISSVSAYWMKWVSSKSENWEFNWALIIKLYLNSNSHELSIKGRASNGFPLGMAQVNYSKPSSSSKRR